MSLARFNLVLLDVPPKVCALTYWLKWKQKSLHYKAAFIRIATNRLMGILSTNAEINGGGTERPPVVDPIGNAPICETKLGETKLVETKLGETKLVETKLGETKLVET
ncbi:MAG: hypothetical protein ACRD72_05215, partial [Candidatus Angelobacter sp.]